MRVRQVELPLTRRVVGRADERQQPRLRARRQPAARVVHGVRSRDHAVAADAGQRAREVLIDDGDEQRVGWERLHPLDNDIAELLQLLARLAHHVHVVGPDGEGVREEEAEQVALELTVVDAQHPHDVRVELVAVVRLAGRTHGRGHAEGEDGAVGLEDHAA